MTRDPLYYLAVEVLDVAARTHFTAGGIEEVIALLVKHRDMIEPIANTGFGSNGLVAIDAPDHVEIVKSVLDTTFPPLVPVKPVRAKKPKAS